MALPREVITRILLVSAASAAAIGLAAATPTPDIPQLWRAEAVGASAPPVYICADQNVVQAFREVLPAIDGQPCSILEPPRRPSPGHFQVRCRAGATMAVAASAVQGDAANDFTVITDISTRPADETQGEPRGEFRQTRRYVHVGACPGDWNISDAAHPGDREVANAANGERRPLAAPYTPPADH